MLLIANVTDFVQQLLKIFGFICFTDARQTHQRAVQGGPWANETERPGTSAEPAWIFRGSVRTS